MVPPVTRKTEILQTVLNKKLIPYFILLHSSATVFVHVLRLRQGIKISLTSFLVTYMEAFLALIGAVTAAICLCTLIEKVSGRATRQSIVKMFKVLATLTMLITFTTLIYAIPITIISYFVCSFFLSLNSLSIFFQ